MLVSGKLPDLVQGVSQQPTELRLPSHCDLADNCFMSLNDGLAKRPPTTNLGALVTTTDDPFVHWINRNETERYVVLIHSGIQVYDLAGTAYQVHFASGTSNFSYVSNGVVTPQQQIKALTIADTTFLINTTQPVAMTLPAPADGNLHWKTTLIWIKTAVLGGTYNVNIDGHSATYTAPNTGTVTTDGIATSLSTAMATSLGSGYTVLPGGSVIMVYRNDTSDFASVSAVDSAGGTAMSVVTNTVQHFSDLPPIAPGNLVVKVVPADPNSGVPTAAGAYYVTFTQKTGVQSPTTLWLGQWQECPGPSTTTNSFDPTTMPYQLVRLIDDSLGTVTGTPFQKYFQYGPVTWGSRLCGDSISVPNPSFVGNTINEIFLYRNRMWFLTDTKIVASQAGNFTNFWRTTMLSVLDTDPIDVSVAHSRVVKLRHAVPSNQDCLIFADQAQWIIQGSDAITPNTIKVLPATEYTCDLYCRPMPVGNLIHIPFRNNGYGAVREYYVEYYTQRRIGKNISEHVPKYMLGSIMRMAHCIASDMTFHLTDADRGSLYVYKWVWEGNQLYSSQKLQSAWMRWNFDIPGVPSKIMGVFFIDQQGYMVVQRSNNVLYLETFICDFQPLDPPAGYITYLDRRLSTSGPPINSTVAQSYNATTNQTTFTLPYPVPPQADMRVVVQGTGLNVPVVSTGTNTLVVNGNLTGFPCWIGNNYTMRYRFSPFYIREQNQSATGGGMSPNINGRLQVRTMTLSFQGTGYFRIELNPYLRDQSVQQWSAVQLGNGLTTLGSIQLQSGKFRCLVGCRNTNVTIDLVNDTPLPCRFSKAEWEGLWFERARRT